MVDVIEREEPACMVCHWTGVHWNGEEVGFKIFQEVVSRLHDRYDNLIWMKLAEISRYWAAKELTALATAPNGAKLVAPFACPGFTLEAKARPGRDPLLRAGAAQTRLQRVGRTLDLRPGTWTQAGGIMHHGLAGLFWSAVPEEHWPEHPEHRAAIESKFEAPYGDRRQEIVFIGQGIDEAQARSALDACLLDDKELAAGADAWAVLPDPFPQWIREVEEQHT